MTEFAMPSFVTEAAISSNANAVTAGSLAEIALRRFSWWSHFTVIAFEGANAAALVYSSASSTIQARNNALGCETCIRSQRNSTVTS